MYPTPPPSYYEPPDYTYKCSYEYCDNSTDTEEGICDECAREEAADRKYDYMVDEGLI